MSSITLQRGLVARPAALASTMPSLSRGLNMQSSQAPLGSVEAAQSGLATLIRSIPELEQHLRNGTERSRSRQPLYPLTRAGLERLLGLEHEQHWHASASDVDTGLSNNGDVYSSAHDSSDALSVASTSSSVSDSDSDEPHQILVLLGRELHEVQLPVVLSPLIQDALFDIESIIRLHGYWPHPSTVVLILQLIEILSTSSPGASLTSTASESPAPERVRIEATSKRKRTFTPFRIPAVFVPIEARMWRNPGRFWPNDAEISDIFEKLERRARRVTVVSMTMTWSSEDDSDDVSAATRTPASSVLPTPCSSPVIKFVENLPVCPIYYNDDPSILYP